MNDDAHALNPLDHGVRRLGNEHPDRFVWVCRSSLEPGPTLCQVA